MFLKQTKKLLYNFFPAKKLALFVFLAILVLGFSAKISFAAPILGDAPKPGTPINQLSPEWQQKINDYNNSYTKYAWIGLPNNITEVPKDSAYYKGFLTGLGGYDDGDAQAAATKYKDNLTYTGASGSIHQQADNGQTPSMLKAFMDSWAGDALFAPIIAALYVIATFCKVLVVWASEVLDVTLNPGFYNFTNNPMIVQGWTMVRDVCNLFFLLVLLFIAICTILKIEKYHAKKTLLMLIIMALLINFSKPIAVFIFDGSQLLMNFFLTQMGQTGTGSTESTIVANTTKIADTIYKSIPNYFGSNESSAELAVEYLFAVVFLFMYAVAIFVTAIFLLIRIVVIMLLIIVSPFAFFAAIVPDFSKMSSQWWSALFEYSYYGPAAAFFLLLATKLESSIPRLAKTTVEGTNINTLITNILFYLTTLVFLYASIIMAKKFGGGAGAAVVGNANRFMKWAGGMTKTGGMWGFGARATGAADVYKGVKGGIAKQPGWRMLTKEGREAKAKERQQKWEEKVAPFNIANVKKKSEEMKNDDISKVNAGVDRGDAASILQAATRGKLTAAQLANPKVRAAMKNNADFENAVYKNLRDTGNGHVQYADMRDRGSTTTEAFDKTYKDLSFNNMAEKGSLKQALTTESASGGDDIFQKMDKLKDTTTIKNLQARATNGETFNVMQKLHDYRVWESGGFAGAAPAGFVGVPSPVTLRTYLMA